jgi:hypothetical protein
MKKKMLSVFATLVLALALVTVPIVFAGDTSTGEAIVGNAAPTITTAGLYTTASADANNTNIDVNVEYWANWTGGDSNTLYDIVNFTVKIWESGTSTENGSDANADHYTFMYSNSTDAWTEVGPDAGGSHLVSGDCQKPADRSVSSGVYRLAWKLATTGAYTATKTWKISIFVWDSGSNAASNKTVIFGVNFYSSLSIDDTSHQWAGLSPGSTNATLTTPADTNINVTVTANGLWDLQAQASAANLVSDGNTIPVGAIMIHDDTLASALNLTVAFVDIGGITGNAAGASIEKDFMLWITIPAGQASGTYTYTLQCQVAQP